MKRQLDKIEEQIKLLVNVSSPSPISSTPTPSAPVSTPSLNEHFSSNTTATYSKDDTPITDEAGVETTHNEGMRI